MNSLLYLFRFIFRIKWWLIICPVLLAIAVYIMSGINRTFNFEVKTTIYTGIVSGYDINSNDGAKQDWNTVNNAMDNIINIITAQTTLKNVSMRLYAQHLIEGDPNKDNNYISAANYRELMNKTPETVKALVDKNSYTRTLENLYAYEQASRDNHIYGLFNWNHRHYSYNALSKILVHRIGSSDMLEIKYVSDDPGIAYNTLKILNEEFVFQYKALRFGETNDVIKYFEGELAKVGTQLRKSEDSLTTYNVDKRVINYDEQTKHIAAMSRDYELRYESILLDYDGATKLIKALESRIDEHVKQLRNNTEFITQLNRIAQLTAAITSAESFTNDSTNIVDINIDKLRKELNTEETSFAQFANVVGSNQYTKEGLSTMSFVQEWLMQVLRLEKAKAELTVMDKRKESLDNQYTYFSPIGSTIKRKEREINFTVESYLSILHSLNTARLRQKGLQMTSATLKVINPPTFPISAIPTKRKLLVLASYIGAIVFIMGFFIILELLDRTLRDKLRTERITSGKVIGAFPIIQKSRYRSFNATWQQEAIRYLSNSMLGQFTEHKPYIINLLSTEAGEGKTTIAQALQEYWQGSGMKVKVLSWHSDFEPENKQYIMANTIDDICNDDDYDVIIFEFPPLKQYSAPRELIHHASVNIIIARANRVWKDTDQLLYDKVADKSKQTPLMIFLNQAREEVVENFTGLLPPYTYIRKLSYRISQLGLTSRM